MKIDNQGLPRAETQSTGSAARTAYSSATERQTETASGASEDEISLSSLGQKIQDLAAVRETERERRIEELAGLVEKGGYEVDAAKVSRKVVEESIETAKLPENR